MAGVPAKHLKYRFDKPIIEKLLKIKWWLLKDDIIKANIDLFTTDVSERLLDDLENKIMNEEIEHG